LPCDACLPCGGQGLEGATGGAGLPRAPAPGGQAAQQDGDGRGDHGQADEGWPHGSPEATPAGRPARSPPVAPWPCRCPRRGARRLRAGWTWPPTRAASSPAPAAGIAPARSRRGAFHA